MHRASSLIWSSSGKGSFHLFYRWRNEGSETLSNQSQVTQLSMQIKEPNTSTPATNLRPLQSKHITVWGLEDTPWCEPVLHILWTQDSHLLYIWRYEAWNPPRPAMFRKEILLNDVLLWKRRMNPISYPNMESFHLPATVFKALRSQLLHGCKFLLWWAHTWMHWCVRRQVSQVPRIQNELELHFKQYIPAVCVNI